MDHVSCIMDQVSCIVFLSLPFSRHLFRDWSPSPLPPLSLPPPPLVRLCPGGSTQDCTLPHQLQSVCHAPAMPVMPCYALLCLCFVFTYKLSCMPYVQPKLYFASLISPFFSIPPPPQKHTSFNCELVFFFFVA